MKGNPPACQQFCGTPALPVPQKSRPSPELTSTPITATLSATRGCPGQCWLSQCPGHGRQAEGRILAARPTVRELTMGAAQESLLTDCANLVPSFLDFPPGGSPCLIQSLDLSQIHTTGWLRVRREGSLCSGPVKTSSGPGSQGDGLLPRPPNAGEPGGLSPQPGAGASASHT